MFHAPGYENIGSLGENIAICPEHGQRREIYCINHGFTCDECGCISSCEDSYIYTEAISTILESLVIRESSLRKMAEAANPAKLTELLNSLTEIESERETGISNLKHKLKEIIQKDGVKFKSEHKRINAKLSDEEGKLSVVAKNLTKYADKTQKIYEKIDSEEDLIKLIEGFEVVNMDLPKFDSSILNTYGNYKAQIDGLKSTKSELKDIQDLLKNYDKLKDNLGSILYTIPNYGSEIISYDTRALKSHRIKTTSITVFPMLFGYTFNKNSIYIAGGTIDMANHLPDTWEVDLNARVEKKLSNLVTGRSENTLVMARECVICLGGRNSEEYIKGIERMDPFDDSQWKEIVKLDKPRSFIGAVYCKSHNTIYMYGGKGHSDVQPVKIQTTNYLTVLNLENATLKDIILETDKVDSAGLICTKHDKINNCSLIIFGGRNDEGKAISNVWLWDQSNLSALPNLAKRDSFYSQRPLLIDNKITVIGAKYLHEYVKDDKESIKAITLCKEIGRAHV